MEILTVGSFDMPLSFWNHEKHEAHENLNLGTSSLSFGVFGVPIFLWHVDSISNTILPVP
jgi:hypothetical protein